MSPGKRRIVGRWPAEKKHRFLSWRTTSSFLNLRNSTHEIQLCFFPYSCFKSFSPLSLQTGYKNQFIIMMNDIINSPWKQDAQCCGVGTEFYGLAVLMPFRVSLVLAEWKWTRNAELQPLCCLQQQVTCDTSLSSPPFLSPLLPHYSYKTIKSRAASPCSSSELVGAEVP